LFFALREEERERKFGNRVGRRIGGTERENVIGG
jgi:hypothetical protein